MSRTLDALVAERVMRWTKADREGMGWGSGPVVWYTNDEESPTFQGFEPTSDIGDVWKVVAKMNERPRNISLTHSPFTDKWTALFMSFREPDGSFVVGVSGEACDKEAPLAICLAALRAVGVTAEEIEAACKEDAR